MSLHSSITYVNIGITSFLFFFNKKLGAVPKITKPKVIKENAVPESIALDLNEMATETQNLAKQSFEKGEKSKDCSNYELFLEIQKLRLDQKIIKNLLKESLNVSNQNEMETIKERFPFQLPLSKDDIELCEEFLSQDENKELMVSYLSV